MALSFFDLQVMFPGKELLVSLINTTDVNFDSEEEILYFSNKMAVASSNLELDKTLLTGSNRLNRKSSGS